MKNISSISLIGSETFGPNKLDNLAGGQYRAVLATPEFLESEFARKLCS